MVQHCSRNVKQAQYMITASPTLNIIFNHDYNYDCVIIITPCYWIQFQNMMIVIKLKLKLGIFCDNFGNFWKSLTISLSCFVSFCIRGTASEPILHRCFRHKCTFTPTRTSSPKIKMWKSWQLMSFSQSWRFLWP